MKVQTNIEKQLTDAFRPSHLQVINESGNHNVPVGSESHFKVVMVSDRFQGKKAVGRHRMVNQTLADDLRNNIHALSLQLFTEEEWTAKGGQFQKSPPCAHQR